MPSLLRGFSAPVKLDAGYDDDELAQLMAHDSDAFTRWDAGQRLAVRGAAGRGPRPAPRSARPAIESAAGRRRSPPCLDRAAEDPAFAARALSLPEQPAISASRWR